ncbi:MAG TPA: response regulator [Ignavibacteria bacterium]|nr:response regulator [Ignavibacteria bacterium]
MKTILVIEDEEIIRETIQDILEEENYKVLTADNGKTGVELAKKEIPDFIICDVMMPELDGYGVINELKSDKSTSLIPFIFLTAKSQKGDLREGMALGADDYLIKPFTTDELLNVISTRLEKAKTIEEKTETKMDELRTNIIYSLPHELRTSLTGILTSLEILQDMNKTSTPEERNEYYEMIETSAKKLETLIRNQLIYTNLELILSNENEKSKYKDAITEFPADIVNKIIEDYKMLYPSRANDVNSHVDNNVKINISEEHFNILINQLIDNTFKHSSSGNRIILTDNSENDEYILEITNEGRALTPEQIKYIGAFMQFQRHHYEQQGLGLGLAIVKNISTLYNAPLEIKAEEDGYTNIKIKFKKIS